MPLAERSLGRAWQVLMCSLFDLLFEVLGDGAQEDMIICEIL